jgi:hypothetical protein
VRSAILVAILVVLGGLVVSAQTTPYITLRFEDPNGTTRDIRTPPGTATAAVQLRDGDTYRDFYIGVTIRDAAAGVILVAVREGRSRDSRLLDEFELRVGAGLKRTMTSPSFGLAVLAIEER